MLVKGVLYMDKFFLNFINLVPVKMCRFSHFNQTLLSLFDVSNVFLN